MKKTIFLFITLIAYVACKNSSEKKHYQEETLNVTTSVYPERMSKVFDAHGGIVAWNKMQILAFTMPKPEGNEVTTTNLWNRKSLIDMPKHAIGFDGEDVWLQKKDTTSYKGNAKFYYNLMFYFYAMPFIVGDDGINYEVAESLQFDSKEYPGIKISYEAGIGESPEDEYILYYNPETYKMEWLGYTVTFFTEEKGKEFHFIKYSDWQTVNGLVLPKTMTWYNYEDNKPTTERKKVDFINVELLHDAPDDAIFTKPEGATIVE